MTRKTWATIAVFIVAVLQLAGFCGLGDNYDPHQPIYALVGHFVPKDQLDRADAYVAAMQRQDLNTLKAMADPSTLDSKYYASIPVIASYLPDAKPVAQGSIQYSVSATSDGRRTAMLMQNRVYANGGVVFTSVYFNLTNNRIEAFQLRTISPADLKKLRFDPMTANTTQAAVAVVALLIIAFGLVTLYRCLATPGLRFKWLWFIFITAGVTSLRFNWMTQTVDFNAIEIHWGPAGIYQQLFQPAVIYLSAPLGALLFWLTGKGRAKGFAKAEAAQ